MNAKQSTVINLNNTNLDNEGEIRLQETASIIQTNATPANTGSGNFIVEKTGTDYGAEYNYWSSPVLSLTRNDVFPNITTQRAYFYDASIQDWVWANDSEALTPTKALIATGKNDFGDSQTRTFLGTNGFHSGNYSSVMSYNDDGGSNSDTDNDWNLVGNPYPSGISATDFLSDNSSVIGNAVYLWNSDGSDFGATSADYAVMNTTGVTNAGGNTAPLSANISSCQSFFVRAIANGSVNFANSQRVGTNNTFLRVNRSDWERIWLTAKHEKGYENQILLGFIPDANEHEDQYDAVKLSGSKHLSFYSQRETKSDNDDLAIQGLPSIGKYNDKIIPLGLNVLTAGEFTFNISHSENFSDTREVFLYDSETKANVDLKNENYKVRLPIGNYTDRFSLRLVGEKITDLADKLDTEVKIFATQNKAVIQFPKLELAHSQIYIYDAIGRLMIKQANSEKLSVEYALAQTGIYVVRVETSMGLITKKIFVE